MHDWDLRWSQCRVDVRQIIPEARRKNQLLSYLG
jgi:hypothetical protein